MTILWAFGLRVYGCLEYIFSIHRAVYTCSTTPNRNDIRPAILHAIVSFHYTRDSSPSRRVRAPDLHLQPVVLLASPSSLPDATRLTPSHPHLPHRAKIRTPSLPILFRYIQVSPCLELQPSHTKGQKGKERTDTSETSKPRAARCPRIQTLVEFQRL
jgi:hypothetical protein